MATRPAIVEGDRNVLITAPTNNALIVTGDRNTVELKLDGAGAALAFAFRWNRPRPRRRGDRPAPPPRFAQHVDRDAEVAALATSDDPPRVANLYGEPGVGKTHVLVAALQRRECAMPDGTVYLDGGERDAEDLLHAIFESLLECRIPLRDLQIERHLADRRALVALEDVALASDRTQRLALGLPRCRLFVTSRERVTLTATPRGDASFAGWSGACLRAQQRSRCDLDIDGPQSVNARFRARTTTGGDEVTLTVVPAGTGSGRVRGPAGAGIDCPPACSARFARGSAPVLTAEADTGSSLADWGDICPGTPLTCPVRLAVARTVRPRFDLVAPQDSAPLTVNISDAGQGSVTSDPAGIDCTSTCTKELPRGQTVTLHAAGADGFRFVGWHDRVCRPSKAGDCVVTIGELSSVTAVFGRDVEIAPTTTTATTAPIG